jgi:nucleoside-diphosphate-sugar epimerase
VRVLVREIVSVAPLARFPLEITTGDVLRPESLAAAVNGCDIVFHCAKGTSGLPQQRRAVDVDGTRNVLAAAARGGVSRAVHVSTMATYQLPRQGVLDERSPRTRSRDLYASSKLEGERVALRFGASGELPVVVIQPTIVYGPHAGVYGRDVIEELRSTRVPLIDGGEGTCNALYIDDLVTALLLAATSERAPGEAFLVSGPEPVTWRAFFEAFERMLAVKRTVSMTRLEALELWKSGSRRPWLVPEALRVFREDAALRRRLLGTREGALVERAAHRLLPSSAWQRSERWFAPRPPDRDDELPLAAFRPFVVDFLASRARVENAKARRLLGYEPVFRLDAGMRLTEEWARWAGLLEGADA